MKKHPVLIVLATGLFALSSCVSKTYIATNNPIGTKVGVAKMSSKDYTFEAAAKNGGITRIGAAEIKTTYVLIFPITKTIVYGE